MIYPTVLINGTNERHIVKDKNYCECGKKYNVFATFTKYDLRKIKFKSDTEITCEHCKGLLAGKF